MKLGIPQLHQPEIQRSSPEKEGLLGAFANAPGIYKGANFIL
jgi:hypothetical protein